ncbi:MAG: tRNA dihydrouridine synthase [Promethearchaeota archaeon]
MKLGPLNLKNNLILAPLQNVTTAPYRRFIRHFQEIGFVCVPMIYIKRITKSPKSVDQELYKIEEESPISVQLIGSDNEALIKAIEYLESYKFNILDINAGCPSRRAIKAKQGGYLLKDLIMLKELLHTAVKFSSRPVSLKTRIGYNKAKEIKAICKVINDSGIDFLTVHARTVKKRFDDRTLDLDSLKAMKDILTIPLIGNGDINSPRSAKDFIESTNVDGLMIGRESMGNPIIFSQINEYLTKGREISCENSREIIRARIKLYEQIIDDFLEGLSINYPLEEYKFVELKRNSIWLTKNLKDSSYLRSELSKAKSLKQFKIILQHIFEN